MKVALTIWAAWAAGVFTREVIGWAFEAWTEPDPVALRMTVHERELQRARVSAMRGNGGR